MKNIFIGITVLGLIALVCGLFILKNSSISDILNRVGGVVTLIGLVGSIYLSRKK
jgi:uncharacterized protein YxeA